MGEDNLTNNVNRLARYYIHSEMHVVQIWTTVTITEWETMALGIW